MENISKSVFIHFSYADFIFHSYQFTFINILRNAYVYITPFVNICIYYQKYIHVKVDRLTYS